MLNTLKYLKQNTKQFPDLQYYIPIVMNIKVSVLIGVTPCGLVFLCNLNMETPHTCNAIVPNNQAACRHVTGGRTLCLLILLAAVLEPVSEESCWLIVYSGAETVIYTFCGYLLVFSKSTGLNHCCLPVEY
jgi:hypothetical protein